jgi:predicted RNA binding protein YcfA (HicA-like mRNA interferase family)
MFSLDGSHLQMKRKELLWTSATTLQTKPKQEFAFNVLSLDGSHMQMKRIELLWTSAKPKQELAFNVLSLDGSHMQMKRIELLWTSTTTLQTKSKQKCVMTTPKKYETKHSVSNHAQDHHSFPVLYRGRPGPKVLS